MVDILNSSDTIELAFADDYHTTILSEQTDPDQLLLEGRPLDMSAIGPRA